MNQLEQLKIHINQALDHLHHGGLTSEQVTLKQKQGESNLIVSNEASSSWKIIIDLAKEPMVYLLLGCGVIYFILGDFQEAVLLVGFLFLILGITIVQEAKAEKALEALRDLSSPRALVLRNGVEERIFGKDVVTQDIILIHEGDRIPADAFIFSSNHLQCNESLLTGESQASVKEDGQMVYAGTCAIAGEAKALVSAIGMETELGKIGKSLRDEKRDFTKLEIETNALVKKLAIFAGVLCIIVVLVYGFYQSSWLDGILSGLTLAMAILPNEIPAVLVIFLALGARRLALHHVLTRQLPAIEHLGAANVLCVDKTGTLTLNQMSVQKLWVFDESIDGVELNQLEQLPESFHETLEYGLLACRENPFDPMEQALFKAGHKFLLGSEHLHHDWTFEKEYPLTSELLSITHVWRSIGNNAFIVGAKGAPEAIIDLCHMAEKEKAVVKMQIEAMALSGMRVLGVAKAKTDKCPLPDIQHDFDFLFVGLIGIADPVRSGVKEAVEQCHRAGIRLVMLTGDHPTTAKSIARQIGLAHADEVLTGFEIDQLSENDLREKLQYINIFSRVKPEQKLKLVKMLKASGNVVAMTGDGVNDAPALKYADIGIAMGERGTDVARESASLVLLNDNFTSIVEAIIIGRSIYHNLKKAFVYLLTIHIPIAGLAVVPVLFNWPLALLPIHIAFLHLIIEPACTLVFESEKMGKSIMQDMPRNNQEPLFSRELWMKSFLVGGSILFSLIVLYAISLRSHLEDQQARSLVFTTLMIANSVLIYKSHRYNKWLMAIIGSSLLFVLLISKVSWLQMYFKFTSLSLHDFIICTLVGFVSVMWMEFISFKSQKS